MPANVAQYVTIIDKSNKVIGNSRQFKDVFFEAKAAYQERKAELKAKKRVKEEEELQKALRAATLRDDSTIRPEGPRRQSTNRTNSYTQTPGRISPPTNPDVRPRTMRAQSNASPRNSGHNTPREGNTRGISLGDFNEQIYGSGPAGYGPQTTPPPNTGNFPWIPTYEPHPDPNNPNLTLVRARTDQPLPLLPHQRPQPQPRSSSASEIDMDLAYGEYHPESLISTPEDARKKELSTLVTRCKGLLEEADCAGHSAKAIIEHLQKNPDTLAAVGLTLAEISSVASKMAPGALAAIGKSAPAVMALLLSPQFLIAVGVGVGVTVIAIGGFKIIKKIRERNAEEDFGNGKNARNTGSGHDEAIDVRELDRVEAWRRGVPESVVDETGSIISGTTVEGEFISPFAARSMGHLPPARSTTSAGPARSKTTKKSSKTKDKDGKTRDGDTESKKSEHKKKHRRRRSEGGDSESVVSKETDGTDSSRGTIRRSKTEKSLVKVKKPSPLSRMFTTGSSVRS